jgi:predicted dehydrogenase
MAMCYRVNAGAIPAESWIQDKEMGGGRIIGEVCHFIDFLTFVNDSLPVSIHASAMQEPQNLRDVVSLSLQYANGSIGTILYFSNGDKSLAKERVEIFSSGV